MKKILAVLLSMILMLSGAAFAEGVQFAIDTISIIENNETVGTIPDPGIRVAFSTGESGVGVRAAIEAGGEVGFEVIGVLSDKLYLSATGISDVYSIGLEDLEKLLGSAENMGASSGIQLTEKDMALISQLISTFTTAAAAGYYSETYEEDNSTITGVTIMNEEVRAMISILLQLANNHPELLSQAGITNIYDVVEIPADVQLAIDAWYNPYEGGVAAGLDLYALELNKTRMVSLYGESDTASYIYLYAMMVEDDNVTQGVDAVIAISEDSGDWMIPVGTASVDIPSMSVGQIGKLMGEAKGLLGLFGLA